MRAILVCLAGIVLSGCAVDEAATRAFGAAAQAEIARHPANFRNGEARAFLVRRDGQDHGLLWGTLHIAYSAETVLPRPVRDRFADAADLTVEIVLDRLPRAQWNADLERIRAANSRRDDDAVRALDPQTRQAMSQAGITEDDLHKLSLRALATLAGRMAGTAAGPLPQFGFVDANLIGFARSVGKPVLGLEGLMELDPTIASPNGDDAASMLRLALRRRPSNQEFGAWIRSRYGEGEAATVYAGLTGWQATGEDQVRTDRLRPSYLAQRNAAWLPKLDRLFRRPGQHFVAFGIAHLLGPDGLVALLRQRGWDVVPCPQDRCPS